MKPLLPMILGATAACLLQVSADESFPAAQRLLDDVIARLPKDCLTLQGELTVRRRRGVVVERLGFDMLLSWGSVPAVARYTIRDAFGSDLEQLTVYRNTEGAPTFRYAAGNPLAPAATPALFDTIRSSDISWIDLALSFLWWEDGEVLGTDEIRGRRCYVVEVPAPPDAARDAGGVSSKSSTAYAKVRLWIDDELRMLLQAEGYDAEDGLIRRLWVRSFKKIDDRWMIKDMEIQGYPAVHRTKLSVWEVGRNSDLPEDEMQDAKHL